MTRLRTKGIVELCLKNCEGYRAFAKHLDHFGRIISCLFRRGTLGRFMYVGVIALVLRKMLDEPQMCSHFS